jgi:hypothetical protein
LATEIGVACTRSRRALARDTLPEALAAIRREHIVPEPPGDLLRDGLRLGRAVRLTLRLLPGDTRCLVSSLVLARLLARRGIPFALVIGVDTEGEFEAHAWIEHAGWALLPDLAPRYRRLAAF